MLVSSYFYTVFISVFSISINPSVVGETKYLLDQEIRKRENFCFRKVKVLKKET